MAKYTLLKMVQLVASAINSDEIDSLGETREANDIQTILEQSLNDLLTRRNWEFLRDKIMLLDAGTTVASLTIPDGVTSLQEVRYSSAKVLGDPKQHREIRYITPAEFLDMSNRQTPLSSNVEEITGPGGILLYVKTDAPPSVYTTFDESELFFDSYNIETDPTGLDPSNSIITATVSITTTSADPTWVAPIPERMFQVWLYEAFAMASTQLRQFDNPRFERMARRAYTQMLDMEPVTTRDEENKVVRYGKRRNR